MNSLKYRVQCLPVFLIALMVQGFVRAQDATYETVQEGLNNPLSVAIQPGTGHVFIADSGALRVIRVVDGKPEEVITDFPQGVDEEPFYPTDTWQSDRWGNLTAAPTRC